MSTGSRLRSTLVAGCLAVLLVLVPCALAEGNEPPLERVAPEVRIRTLRFLSVDPKRMGKPVAGQSWNRYAYTEGNPLKFVDPDGEETRGVFEFERRLERTV